MSIAVIADSHLGGPGGEAGPMVEQLRALPARGCRRLVLMGDIFQVWVGDPRFETEEIRVIVKALEELRAAGIEIDYIEGNRDFFLQNGPYARLFDRLGTEVAFEVGGTRYLAVHGDGVNRADWQYLFWRWFSKSALVRFFAMNLPAWLARRLMGSTERRLSKTNFKHKRRIPEEAIRGYAAERLGKDHDVLLLGHFHQERTWRIEQGEIRLLEAWFVEQQVEWLE